MVNNWGLFNLRDNVCPPVYSQIALDIAQRITRGELKENEKIYGRSVMSSEYGVSPETIRRALKLLEDMGIVEIKQNSGAMVLSLDKAKQYIERFNEQSNIRNLQRTLNNLIKQQHELNDKILDVADSIVRINEKYSKSTPFQNYEISVPKQSHVIGKSLLELKFWQQTGATIIAIGRGDNIILSPGPYAVLQEKDSIIFVGDISTIDIVEGYIKNLY